MTTHIKIEGEKDIVFIGMRLYESGFFHDRSNEKDGNNFKWSTDSRDPPKHNKSKVCKYLAILCLSVFL